jgi:hypothetical protein
MHDDDDDMFQGGYLIHYSASGKVLRTWKANDRTAQALLHQAPTRSEENFEDRKKQLQRKEQELVDHYRQKELALEDHYKSLHQKKEAELQAHYTRKLKLALAELENARASLVPRRPVSQLFTGIT